MAVSSIGSTLSWASPASSASSAAGRVTTSSVTRLSTAGTSSTGRGDTYTCSICGKKIPVGMTHDQYHALSQPRATVFPTSTSSVSSKGLTSGPAVSKAAIAYTSSTTAWAR